MIMMFVAFSFRNQWTIGFTGLSLRPGTSEININAQLKASHSRRLLEVELIGRSSGSVSQHGFGKMWVLLLLGTVWFFLSLLASPLWFLIGGHIPDIFSSRSKTASWLCNAAHQKTGIGRTICLGPPIWHILAHLNPLVDEHVPHSNGLVAQGSGTRVIRVMPYSWGCPSWISLVQCHYSGCQVFTSRGTTSATGPWRDRCCLAPLQGIGEAAATSFGAGWIFVLIQSSILIYVPYNIWLYYIYVCM